MHLVRGRFSCKIGIDMTTSEVQLEHLHSCRQTSTTNTPKEVANGLQSGQGSRLTTDSTYLKIRPTFSPSPK
jgi:hypothetical protein